MSTTRPTTRNYVFTWLLLLGLTLLTSTLGLVDLGRFTLILAVLIAIAKASLVAFIFMHAGYESRLIRVGITVGVVYILFLLTLTMGDYLSRGWLLPSGK